MAFLCYNKTNEMGQPQNFTDNSCLLLTHMHTHTRLNLRWVNVKEYIGRMREGGNLSLLILYALGTLNREHFWASMNFNFLLLILIIIFIISIHTYSILFEIYFNCCTFHCFATLERNFNELIRARSCCCCDSSKASLPANHFMWIALLL